MELPASSSNADRGSIYRAAVCLNNIGVKLLAQNLWVPAVATFRDAMRLMKASVSENTLVTQQELRDILRKARLHNIEQQSSSMTVGPSVKPISSQNDPSVVCSTLRFCSNLESTVLPITIDPIDFENACSAEHFESAAILYNFGLAYNCVSTTAETETVQRRLQRTALHVFQLSESIVSNLHKSYCENKVHLPSQVLLISMLLALTLMHSTSAMHPSVSQGYFMYLEDFLTFVRSREDIMPKSSSKIAPAA